jgi:hypothetical protein
MAVARVRRAIFQQARSLATDVRSAIDKQIAALYANGKPTAQRIADFNSAVMGISDVVALRLSSQADLLPGSSARLIPRLQDSLLGSGSNSLISRIQSLSGSSPSSASGLRAVVTRQVNATLRGVSGQFGNYFRTTNINRLSVGPNGGRVSLQQFMGNRLMSQVSNSLGQLAQSFPGVASSALFPNGTIDANGLPISPSQDLLTAFNRQAGTALQTAAFQLGSGLSILPGTSQIPSQITPVLWGSGADSLFSSLRDLPFGSTNFNSSVSSAFNSSFQSLGGVVNPSIALQARPNATLPTSGFTNLFGSDFTGSNFAGGFNNGFATAPATGFIGFGQAPAGFNTNFGTGFNNLVSGMNTGFGFGTVSL